MVIDPISAATAACAVVLVFLVVAVLRLLAAAQHQRVVAEQAFAGQRAEAEATRAALAAAERALTVRVEQGRVEQAAWLREIERSVGEQLHEAVERQMTTSFQRVLDQFAAVQKAMVDVQAVTAQIGDLKRIFSNVKTRGGWGETQLRALLDDLLPPGGYLAQARLGEGLVDFAVRMPGRGEPRPLLAIDAKFPLADYERLVLAAEAGDADGERAARRALETTLRIEARRIAGKYIAPPDSVEFAVMYLPTDGLYAEAARLPGLIDDLGRTCRVLLMGPGLLPGLLRTIHLGYVTLALEQKAGEIGRLLGATRGEMVKMDGVLERLARNAAAMSSTIEDARVRTRVVARRLREVDGEAAPAACEDAATVSVPL